MAGLVLAFMVGGALGLIGYAVGCALVDWRARRGR